MTTTGEFLHRLRGLGVRLWADGGDLCFHSPKGALTPELAAELRRRKPELMAILTPAEERARPNLPPIQPAPRDGHPPLSFSQQRLWFLDQLEGGGNTAYNITLGLRLEGCLDVAALERTLAAIVARHESLRTVFGSEDGRPVQIIKPVARLTIPAIDLGGFPGQDPMSPKDSPLRRLVLHEIKYVFDLAKGPLFRAVLIRLAPEDHVLTLAMHHIISDGWSMGVIRRELVILYETLLAGRPPRLAPLPIQYADYAAWQRRHLGDAALTSQLDFWKRRLAGAPTLHQLPTDFPRPPKQTYDGGHVALMIPEETSHALRALSRRSGASMFMCLYSAFSVLLARYSGADDLVVGTPVANRGFHEIEPLIGFFVNTLALRTDLSGDPSFLALLERLRRDSLEAFANQDAPFEQVVDVLKPERSLSHSPVFQILFVLQNTPEEEDVRVSGLTLSPVGSALAGTKFDLSLTIKEQPDGVRGLFEYNVALFEKASIQRLSRHFGHVLAAVAADPDRKISALPLLSAEERARLLTEINDTARPLPEAPRLHRLIEAQTTRTPAATALIGPVYGQDGRDMARIELSYEELTARAGDFAARLRAHGAGPDSVVAVLCRRSAEMTIALLGILEAGAAYLPIDPDTPAERIDAMLEDAGAAVIAAHPDHGRRAGGAPTATIDASAPPPAPSRSAAPGPPPDAAAYVIFTSGSTGRPKGAVNTHRAICNRLLWMQDAFSLTAEDRVLQKTPYTFDVSVWEFFWPLIAGAAIVTAKPEGHRDPLYLAELITAEDVTTIHFVPSMLRAFLSVAPSAAGVPLKRVICSGEALTSALRDQFYQWLAAGGGLAALHNLYGPTEAAIDTTWQPCRRDDADPRVPIGKPIANIRVYVLERGLEPAPLGAAGELCLAGAGLARGYVNRPELTAAAFTPDPYAPESGQRLYHTGDLVRFRPLTDDGVGPIEFLGRIDHQIKLRGFRIELGEIERALTAFPDVGDAAVVAREDRPGDVRLIAYLEAGAAKPNEAALRSALQKRLPAYMTPNAFVFLERMPLNASGKLDRRALPAPDTARRADPGRALPQTAAERRIAEIWRELLRVDDVGRDDNFFDLGGHSLLLVQAFSQLRIAFPREFEMTDLFQHTTVRSLASFLGRDAESADEAESAAAPAQPAGPTQDDIALVGMSLRFPGADTPEAFWANLRDGVESITFFSDEELRDAGVHQALIDHKDFVPAASFLEDVDKFDASFFGVTPKDAELTDPQQRFFLEEAWRALEHAGYDPEAFPGLIGVFAGVGVNNYLIDNLTNRPQMFAGVSLIQSVMGNDKDYVATRTAYRLNLKGPCVTVQSACSTALAAVHFARQSLLAGDCDMALAGGSTVAEPQMGYLYQEGMLLSPDGHCRAFDAEAKGTMFGSGVGVLVLKRLSDALAAGDFIHAVIKGVALNNDGSDKVGFTAPGVNGQAAVIEKALANADVPSESIGYIETHGTGTPLGDPIEVAALNRAYRRDARGKGSVAIGSVKSNVGHLDSAAGAAGLIKTALALRHKMIPPSLHFEKPNPKINFDGLFYVNAKLAPWESGDHPRRAGVSSFGIGGTNAHAIVEEPPELEPSDPAGPRQLLVLSARTDAALDARAAQLADWLEAEPSVNLGDAAFTLQAGRRAFAHRRALVCRNREEAIELLRRADGRGSRRRVQETVERPIAFLFPGQGAQHPNMAAETYEAEPVFRETLDACAESLRPRLGLDLRTLLFPAADALEEAEQRLTRTDIAQPALFSVSYALARLWLSWGLRPQAMAGHSVGEYTAACLAGVLTREDALALVAERGRLMASMPEGAMLAVPLDEAEIAPWIAGPISLAAVNGPGQVTLSGPSDDIESTRRRLAEDGVEARRLVTSHAFHSAMMDPILAPFTERVRAVTLQPPRIPFLSNVTGDWIADHEATDPAYWARHLRGAVRFGANIGRLLEDPDRLLLEIGPGRTLTTLAQRRPDRDRQEIINTLPHARDRQSDHEFLTAALGKCWLAGLQPDWRGVHGSRRRRRTPLPAYPFERQRYWPEDEEPTARQAAPVNPMAKQKDMADWFYAPDWRSAPLLAAGKSEPPGPCLLFADDQGLSAQLAESLSRLGAACVSITAGERFEKLEDGGYVIDPREAGHYDALFEAISRDGFTPTAVIHAWSLTGQAHQLSLEDIQNRGFFSLVYLAQALGKGQFDGKLELLVAADSMLEVAGEAGRFPEKSTLIGPCMVIPSEYPNLRCRLIDLAWPDESDAAWRRARIVDQLLAELTAETEDGVIALRGGRRLKRAFERLPLRERPAQPPLRQGGVYLITGGWGGIGFTLAKRLAESTAAKLVLTGRSELPPRAEWDAVLAAAEPGDKTADRIERVGALEALGAETLTIAADAADEAATRAAVDRAIARFGAIHGVIHAAGLPSGGVIQLKTQARMTPILAPKVDGTLILDRVFADKPLDFMLLCSSVTGVTGGFGQVDYCAANAFMDVYAACRAASHGWRAISVNWDAWTEIGMAAEAAAGGWSIGSAGAKQTDDRRQAEAFVGIDPDEGVDAFERVLESGVPQVAVSVKDLHAVMRAMAAQVAQRREREDPTEAGTAPAPSAPKHPRPNLDTPFVAPSSEVERTLAEIWGECLGIGEIGVEDNFFDLGGDSLLASQIVSRLQRAFEVNISMAGLFDEPTILGLAQLIEAIRAEREETPDDGEDRERGRL